MFDAISRSIRKLARDPTTDWPAPRLDHAVIDTTAQTVCGIRLPCDPAQLRAIGRPSNRHAFVDGFVSYHDLGATFWLDTKRRVCDVGVCLFDSGGDGPPARQCEVVGRHRHCVLKPGSNVKELVAAVGDGGVAGPDDDPEWTFRLGTFDMTAECTRDGTVRYLHYFVV